MAAPIDRDRAKFLNATLMETLKAWADLNGLVVEPYRLTFSSNQLRCRLQVNQPDTLGAPVRNAKADAQAMAYKARAKQHGLPPLGSHIKIRGRVFKLTGMRVKNVTMIEVATGKPFKAPIHVAANAMVMP